MTEGGSPSLRVASRCQHAACALGGARHGLGLGLALPSSMFRALGFLVLWGFTACVSCRFASLFVFCAASQLRIDFLQDPKFGHFRWIHTQVPQLGCSAYCNRFPHCKVLF